jgi:hypothetical protein
MHPLQKRLIENPEILQGIEEAILWRKKLLNEAYSGSTAESIKAEEEAVKQYKMTIKTKENELTLNTIL